MGRAEENIERAQIAKEIVIQMLEKGLVYLPNNAKTPEEFNELVSQEVSKVFTTIYGSVANCTKINSEASKASVY